MLNFKTDFKKLYKAYSKKLKQLHNKNVSNIPGNLDYFITYLTFLRDYYILTEPLVLESGEENMKIASLATAISEYSKFKNCINSYYNTTSTGVFRKIEGTEEEVLNKYNTEKAFHWETFWSLVKLNMEDWTINAEL